MWSSDSDSDSFCGSDSDSGEGKRKRSLARSLDYECVERFRLRRLLGFLQHHRYDGAYESLSKETKVLFRTEHLQHLVREGLWRDAIKYVYRFIPASDLPCHGTFLVKFIIFVLRINDHSYEYDPRSPFQIHLHGGVSRGGVKLAKIISSVRSNQACSIDWSLVRIKAAEIVGELVAQIPEFSDLSRLPFCSAKPANVLPVGLRSRCHKVHKKKSRMPAYDVARSFQTMRRLIPSKETSDSGIPLEPATMTRLAKLVEECLQAGKCLMSNAKHPVESSCTEGMEMTAGAYV